MLRAGGGVAWRRWLPLPRRRSAVARGRGRHRILPTFSALLPMQPANRSSGHSFRERSLRPEVTRRAAEGKKTRRGAARRCGILEKVILVVFPPPIRAGVQLQLVGTRHHVAVLLSAWERVALPTFLASLWAGRWSRSRRYGKGKKEAAVRPAVESTAEGSCSCGFVKPCRSTSVVQLPEMCDVSEQRHQEPDIGRRGLKIVIGIRSPILRGVFLY